MGDPPGDTGMIGGIDKIRPNFERLYNQPPFPETLHKPPCNGCLPASAMGSSNYNPRDALGSHSCMIFHNYSGRPGRLIPFARDKLSSNSEYAKYQDYYPQEMGSALSQQIHSYPKDTDIMNRMRELLKNAADGT